MKFVPTAEKLSVWVESLVDTVSGVRLVKLRDGAEDMLTVRILDQLETTDVWLAHLACAFTAHAPALLQLLAAEVVPAGNHPELVPSPQSKKY